jgi:hypothetical protein
MAKEALASLVVTQENSSLRAFWGGLNGGKKKDFGNYELSIVKKRIGRKLFLSDMEAVVPLQAPIHLIESLFPKRAVLKGGRLLFSSLTILRAHLMQQWFDLRTKSLPHGER